MKKNLENWQQPEKIWEEYLIVARFEVRTPLTAIFAYADLLLKGFQGKGIGEPLKEEQVKWLTEFRKNAEYLLDSFNQRRMFDEGAVEIRTRITAMLAYVDILLSGKAGSLQEQQVELVTRLSKTTQDLRIVFDNIFEMYYAVNDRLPFDAEEDVEFTKFLQETLPNEVEFVIVGEIPKVCVDKKRITQAITDLLDPFYYKNAVVKLGYDNSQVRFDIIMSDFSCHKPMLFYLWRVIQKHSGRMEYEEKGQSSEIHCFLPISQDETSV